MTSRSEYREEFCDQVLSDDQMTWMGDMRELVKGIFQDKKSLKWTILIAIRGGSFKHCFNSYYPETRAGLGLEHVGGLVDRNLAVKIDENHFKEIGQTKEFEYLRDRRDPSTETDMSQTENLDLRLSIDDGRIQELVREIAKEDTAEYLDTAGLSVDQINDEDWIFLTELGEEIYQSLFGTGRSLRVTAELFRTQFPEFMKSLPKATQIGGNRYVPDPYRFALEGPEMEVFEYSDDGHEKGVPQRDKERIIDILTSHLSDCDKATVLIPWYENRDLLTQLRDGPAEYTVVFDKSVVEDYSNNPRSQERYDNLLFSQQNGEDAGLSHQVQSADNNYLGSESHIPYILVLTESPDPGQLVLFCKGGIGYEPDRVILEVESSGSEDDLYTWGKELVDEIVAEAEPFDQAVGD